MIVIDERTGEVKKVSKKPEEYLKEKHKIADAIAEAYKGHPIITTSEGDIMIIDDNLTTTSVKAKMSKKGVVLK